MHDIDLNKTNGNINSLEDRLWLAANLVSLEEHAYSSYLRTSDWRYVKMMEVYREQRIKVFEEILGAHAALHEAEIWCMFKHALGAAMRAYESGNRDTQTDPILASVYFDISKKMIEQAFELIEINIASEEYVKREDQGKPDSYKKSSGNAAVPGGTEKAAKKEKKGILYYLKCCLE